MSGTDNESTAQDEQAPQEQEQTTDQPSTGGTETDPEKLQAEVEKWKHLSRKNEETARRNAEAAKQWAQYQDSRKTEDQKAQEEREQLIQERDEARRQAALFEAATKHGLSAEDLALLDGVPADQLTERAEKLAARLKPVRQPSPSAGIGRETPPNARASQDWLRGALTNSD